MIGTLTWSLGTCRILCLEPLYLEPWNLRNLTWNPYLEPRNLPEPLLGTLILGTFGTLLGTLTWNLGTCRNLYLEPLLGTSEPAGTFIKLTWNLGARRNLYLEPLLGTSEPAGTFTWNPYLEPRNLPEPLLGTLTWNLGTCQNLAGWLPQSAPGLSLAETPKLSAVGEKILRRRNRRKKTHPNTPSPPPSSGFTRFARFGSRFGLCQQLSQAIHTVAHHTTGGADGLSGQQTPLRQLQLKAFLVFFEFFLGGKCFINVFFWCFWGSFGFCWVVWCFFLLSLSFSKVVSWFLMVFVWFFVVF